MHSVLKSLLLLGSVTLISCGDDEGSVTIRPDSGVDTSSKDSAPTDETGTNNPSSSANESTTEREGPEGCYLQESHACDCSITSEADCEGVGLWTQGCTSCTPASEDAGVDAQTDVDGSTRGPTGPGCYEPTSHACDCNTNESACVETDGVWTDLCECVLTDASTETSSSDADVDSGTVSDGAVTTEPGPTGPGCYDPVSHACACASNETACVEVDRVWTAQCECPVTDAATTDSSFASDSSTTSSESTATSDAGPETDAATAPDSGEIVDAAQ